MAAARAPREGSIIFIYLPLSNAILIICATIPTIPSALTSQFFYTLFCFFFGGEYSDYFSTTVFIITHRCYNINYHKYYLSFYFGGSGGNRTHLKAYELLLSSTIKLTPLITYILYHIYFDLSRGILKVFKIFFDWLTQ